MKDDNFIISGFDRDPEQVNPLSFNFANAKPLDRTGSTCDAYVCTIQRRRVFIKRLKAEFRDNPMYRDAFDKEYDLGVSLSHPSLPRYIGFGVDYIIMDYIEGDTLADLIKRGDRRLKDKRFVQKRLSELIDVVEYLHHRNIVHCDIKSDNIIISPYNDRPATLIDLDKAYTSWLDNTSGNPAKYDCDGCDDGKIDFRGIGKIADQLGQKHIAAACRNKDVNADTIRKELKRLTIRKWIWRSIIFIGGILSCVIAFWAINRYEGPLDQPSHPAAKSQDTIAKGQIQEVLTVDTVIKKRPDSSLTNEKSDETLTPEPVVKMPKHESTADNSESVKDTPDDDMSEVDDIVKQCYGPLYKRHKYLRNLAGNPKMSAEDLLNAYKSYAKDQYEAQSRIFNAVKKLYGLGDPFESMGIVCRNKEWSRFMKADDEINKLYGREIEKREKADSLKRR